MCGAALKREQTSRPLPIENEGRRALVPRVGLPKISTPPDPWRKVIRVPGARGRLPDAIPLFAGFHSRPGQLCVALRMVRSQRETDVRDMYVDDRRVAHTSDAAPMLSTFGKKRLDGSSSCLWCELDRCFGCSPLARRWAPSWQGQRESGVREAQARTRPYVA